MRTDFGGRLKHVGAILHGDLTMHAMSRTLLAVAGVVFATHAAAQATFFEDEGFAGRSVNATQQIPAFERQGFNDRASSVVIVGERWEICQDSQFKGPCLVLRPGRYPSLSAMGLNDRISSARIVSRNARIDDDRYAPAPEAAQVTFYEREGFEGRSFSAAEQVANLRRTGFKERAASAVVVGDRWEVCDDTRFRGRCVVLRPGRYASLAAMGLNDRISSVRAVAADARIAEDRYAPAPVTGQATFFEQEGFAGRSFATQGQVANLQGAGFNGRAQSAVVLGDSWEVCDDARFNGRCVVLRPGRYASLAAMGLNDRVSSVRTLPSNMRIDDARYAPAPMTGQVSFFESEGFAGRSFTTEESVANLQRSGFNDRAASAIVLGDRYEVCDDAGFGGRCVVLRPGRYPSMAAMGLNNRISSVRAVEWNARVGDDRYAPAPVPVYDSRRRGGERVYEANVSSSRGVLATSGQRCWVESEQVQQERSGANVPGAIVGAILGGVLGHQVGGGTGKDIATVGGVVAGAAVGANVGRGGGTTAQDVQRCENVPGGAQPAYWDVTYNFRGQDHRVQMATAPGRTITVNEQGEPRQ
jgi:uncharacterized protein YcfJ/uncharacterized protein (UPF0179 family)